MYRTILSFVSILLIINNLSFSQNQRTVFCGKITNTAAFIAFLNSEDVYNSIRDTSKVFDDKTFHFDIELSKPGFFTFKYYREIATLFLCPGDSVYAEFEYLHFDESLKYSGKGAEVNNYLISKLLYQEKNFLPVIEMYKLDEPAFIRYTDSLKTELNNYLESFLSTNLSNLQSFEDLEKASILYMWSIYRLNYPYLHPSYAKIDGFQVSDNYYDYAKKLDFNNEDYLQLSKYQYFVRGYFISLARNKVSEDEQLSRMPNAESIIAIQKINESVKSSKIKDYLNYYILFDQFSNKGIRGMDAIYNDFVKNCTNGNYKATIMSLYQKWEPLKEGVIAPTFSFTDTSDIKIPLEKFKGKYVYIDVWATWCKPCMREIPLLKQLEEEFKNKNIEFLSISIDQDKKAWHTLVKRLDLKGTQLHVGEFHQKFSDDYYITTIPRFILLDKQGKIIDVNAQRPTEGVRNLLLDLDGI